MRVLWLTNARLSVADEGRSGTWLGAMVSGLRAVGSTDVAVLSIADVRSPERADVAGVLQWLVPALSARSQSSRTGVQVRGLLETEINQWRPDLLHIWGTESHWGALTLERAADMPSLLEIQGLMGACARVFPGGLSRREQSACIGIKEIARRGTIESMRTRFKRWGAIEDKVIAAQQHISVHSKWAEGWVRALNASAIVHHTQRVLRSSFYRAEAWAPSDSRALFCSAAYAAPFKGLHDAIRMLALVRRTLPGTTLRIAGALPRNGLRADGYAKWLERLAVREGVADAIEWLGALDAEGVAKALLRSAAMIMPSHCESYCVALAEAQMLGVPVVAAYTGGTAALARDEETALFYGPGDERMCAWQVGRILRDADLATRLGREARRHAQERHRLVNVIANQERIYKAVVRHSATA